MSVSLQRGEVAPGVFKFLQRDATIEVGCPLKSTVVGTDMGAEPHEVVLNVHVFTHQGDAAVSCRMYRKETDEHRPHDVRMATPDGTTTQNIVHTSSLGLSPEVGFYEAIVLAIKALEEQELAIFADATDEEKIAIQEAFAKAKDMLIGDAKDE